MYNDNNSDCKAELNMAKKSGMDPRVMLYIIKDHSDQLNIPLLMDYFNDNAPSIRYNTVRARYIEIEYNGEDIKQLLTDFLIDIVEEYIVLDDHDKTNIYNNIDVCFDITECDENNITIEINK